MDHRTTDIVFVLSYNKQNVDIPYCRPSKKKDSFPLVGVRMFSSGKH